MHLLNRDFYGFMLMPVTQQEDWDSHVDDYEQFVHLKIENISKYRMIGRSVCVPLNQYFYTFLNPV